MEKQHLLVVDDDLEICELLRDYLQQQGFSVSTQANGKDILTIIHEQQIDLVILDVMLPEEDGLSLCQTMRRASDVMIIMLSAVDADADRILGIEMGADDYLTKPFNARELLARIKGLIRLTQGELGQQRQQRQAEKISNIQFADWHIDRSKQQLLSPQQITIPLTQGEYALLIALVTHNQQILNRDQLPSLTHNRAAGPFDRTIDVQIARLRKKNRNRSEKS